MSSLVGTLFINEVMPKNDGACVDEDGEPDDWIELYNASSDAVSLDGLTISDDDGDLGKASLDKGLTVPANEVLLLWADGTNSPDAAHAAHLGFKLGAAAEGVVLADSAGAIIDQVSWTDALGDVSYARFPDGGADVARCALSTCGETNGDACE